MTSIPDDNSELNTQSSANRNITDIPDIYPAPGWVWQYPPVKQSILKFAKPLALSIVELFHYALFLTQLGVAYALYRFPPHTSYESMFWLMMAPVFQILAGFAPIVMHEYEGWQVAPFQDQPLNRGQYNNERLREAAYKLLFAYQAVAAIMFIIGVYGIQQWKIGFLTISNPWTLIILGSTFVWLYIGPRTPLSTFYVDLGQGKRPVFPIPLGILVTFAIATIIYIIAMIHLYGLVPALITTLFLLLGGATEGLIAESTFNQFWHFLAVVFLGAAGITQIIALVYL
ncbi:hypothetical protein H6G33_36385 [Calothrix sp. FACHB-1219]|uniref:hypothetical protein n=1 Tax=unclassified Calothrix TaxID=2619626 RepID=UPI0016820FFD|nr:MULTISPECIES: hypothetical protein [unclassified Calothrix]MBD2207791.1 hypothetical protein [Calothrix sp. FACHB-168]MBD2222411.1 hypothetical protein [Calothrix sp. FACHB-1219]